MPENQAIANASVVVYVKSFLILLFCLYLLCLAAFVPNGLLLDAYTTA